VQIRRGLDASRATVVVSQKRILTDDTAGADEGKHLLI
jgi:hypothetical protein